MKIKELIIMFVLAFILLSGCSAHLSGEAVPTENSTMNSGTDATGGGTVLEEHQW